MPRRVLATRTATLDTESSRRLASAFDRAIENASEQTMHVLNVAAVDFVDRLKVGGMTPERVIVTMKNVLRTGLRLEEGWFPSLDVGNSWIASHGASAVYERVFGWCVDAYFDQTDRPPRRRAVVRHGRPSPPTAWPATH
jgi:hypothetical protein